MTISQWFLLLIGILMSALGGFFLKVGAVQLKYEDGILSLFSQLTNNWWIIFGVLLYFIPVLIWIFLLKKIELSFLQPLFSMVYVVTPVLASIFLYENISINRWLGIGVIITGVLIVARS